MASNLIVETGAGVPDASSYASAAVVRAYAFARGVILAPADDNGDALVDQMVVKAMDYIEANRANFHGWRAADAQRLSFPRLGVPVASNPDVFRPQEPLPPELGEALCRLVMAVKAGVDLLPTTVSGKFVKKQKLGPLEREFSETIGVFALPQMPDVDALLASLIKSRGPMISYRV